MRTAGARTDHSTGIHIHVGAERFDAKSVVNLVKLVHKQERLLEHALGVSEQRLARYCRPIDARFIEALEGHPRFYRRTRIALEDGAKVETYLLTPEQVEGRPVIISGNWRSRRKEKAA